jgi:pyridoxine 5-phosphate synthase
MIHLSVNVNKFATLRNARGGNNPNVLTAALDALRMGAHGITVHPRPDERHIRKSDVLAISQHIQNAEFNIEGYPSDDFLRMIEEIKPQQATLVPDPPDALTSNAGWDCIENKDFLTAVIRRIQNAGVRTSIFIAANPNDIVAAAATGTDRIELYTEPYAAQYPINPEAAIQPFILAAQKAQQLGLGINAGHDLSLENLAYFAQHIPGLLEVSIGHALVCDALYLGLEKSIQSYLQCLRQ